MCVGDRINYDTHLLRIRFVLPSDSVTRRSCRKGPILSFRFHFCSSTEKDLDIFGILSAHVQFCRQQRSVLS